MIFISAFGQWKPSMQTLSFVLVNFKKFVLIYEEFTINNGMLTPTLKLKRKEIIKNYKQQLENLY